MPRQIASSGRSSRADRNSTALSNASACATDGGPAYAAEAPRPSGSERISRIRTGPGMARKMRVNGERTIRSSDARS